MEVEAVKLVAGLLRIHHVLEDNECSSLRIVRDALTDLAVLYQYATHSCLEFGGYVPDWAEFAKEIEEFLGSNVIAAGH